jgi:hypothetical protein
MSLLPFLNEFFKTEEAKATCNIILDLGSKCESFIEFGSRGGVSSIAILQALLNGKKQSPWSPRFTAMDLAEDDSITKLHEISAKIGVSFQFWKGHSAEFPVFEADGFMWDTFHSAGNLLVDLERVGPGIHKYIFILGTRIDGVESEAVRRKLDIDITANELRVPSPSVKHGLGIAISEFLKKHPEWTKETDFGELTVLKRTTANPDWVFKN